MPEEPEDPLLRRFIEAAADRLSGRQTHVSNSERRLRLIRISDKAFETCETVRRKFAYLLSQDAHAPALRGEIVVPLALQGEAGESDEYEESVPRTVAGSVAATVEYARRIRGQSEELTVRNSILTDVVAETLEALRSVNQFNVLTIADRSPSLYGALVALAEDALNGHSAADNISAGLAIDSMLPNGDFTVEAASDDPGTCHNIAAGLLRRLRELSAEERAAIIKDAELWKVHAQKLALGRTSDIPSIKQTYKSLVIPDAELRSLVSTVPSIKEAAKASIERRGGFLHREHDPDDLDTMLQCVTIVYRDEAIEGSPTIAHIGMIDKDDAVKKRLHHLFGFDPNVNYSDRLPNPNPLPTESALGKIQWSNPSYARSMFMHPEHFACTIELAVNKDLVRQGVARRDAGIATALKYRAFNDVQKPMIVTMYFEIIEVDGQSVPSATNMNSKTLIETVTKGKEVGVLQEEFTVESPQGQIQLKVNWHIIIEQRDQAIREIEARRRVTKLS